MHALDARLQGLWVTGGVERQAQILASVLVLTEPRCRAHAPQDLGHTGVDIGRLAKFDPETVRAVSTVRVQCYPGAVRPTPPECRQHTQHRHAECNLLPLGLANVSHNATHRTLLILKRR